MTQRGKFFLLIGALVCGLLALLTSCSDCTCTVVVGSIEPTQTATPGEGATSAPTHTATNTPSPGPSPTPTQTPLPTNTPRPSTTPTPTVTPIPSGNSRGYLITPRELAQVAAFARAGIEPHVTHVDRVIMFADEQWAYTIDAIATCSSADTPKWLDNNYGGGRLYARALAYHLMGEVSYAEETRQIINQIVVTVESIGSEQQCMLNFGWGIPELVASADLIEGYWPPEEKRAFQEWLTIPYRTVSWAAEASQGNWGAAGTNAIAHIADYLQDRPDITLEHRLPDELGGGAIRLTPTEAYERANTLALDRMNGYRVDYHSSSACDYMSGNQQLPQYDPVKSQITAEGIIPDDARRAEYCNITTYNGSYQNYPQVHIGNLVQQAELQRRRGSTVLYDNIAQASILKYEFTDGNGDVHTTTLSAWRGSLKRAIHAIIAADTDWRHDEALAVAYGYYGVGEWVAAIDESLTCDQDACFGQLGIGLESVNTARGLLTRQSAVTTATPTSAALDVFVQAGGIEYQCYSVIHTTSEAPHETEIPVTYAPPPTFTPSVFASPTPAPEPTPTQQIATSTPAPRWTPYPTLTPTTYPTSATTPMSACIGTVKANNGLYVRSVPYGAILGAVWNGQRVELHGYTDVGDRWYRIWWASWEQWGYIHADYVETGVKCWGLTEG